MKRFRTCSLDQPLLLPVSLQEWLPENHLACFVGRIVDQLDVSKILEQYGRRDGRGKAAYHPVMLLRLLLYGYAIGVRSSRTIEKATYDDLGFRYLASDQHPDHDTIAEFRKVHLEQIEQLFLQMLQLCQKAGLVKMGQMAVDGSKMAANASRQQNRKYERLCADEQSLDQQVRQALAEAETADRQEDQWFGKGQRSEPLPPELATAQAQLEKIRAAKQELECEAQEKAEQVQREKAEQGNKAKNASQRKRWRRGASVKPKANQKGNLTDADSRLMKDGSNGAFVQGYNTQLVTAGIPQIIVAHDVVQEANDRKQLISMMHKAQQNLGVAADLTVADAGYWDEDSIVKQQAKDLNVLVPPDRGPDKKTGRLHANAPQGPAAQQMRERLQDPEQKKLYQQRCALIEPVFGMIKEVLGYRRFLLRGLEKVCGEWGLICTAFNLRKLFQAELAKHKAKKATAFALAG